MLLGDLILVLGRIESMRTRLLILGVALLIAAGALVWYFGGSEPQEQFPKQRADRFSLTCEEWQEMARDFYMSAPENTPVKTPAGRPRACSVPKRPR